MPKPGFIHLHTHTEFSLLDGASRIPDLVKQAVEMEMPAMAITDHGVMYGNISFYGEMKSAGVKPILGCEVYVAPRTRHDRDSRLDKEQYHLVLLAQSEKGYKNLIKLVSLAYSEGHYYKPRVDKELLAQYHEDLIALTGCIGGEVPSWILKNDLARAERALAEYAEIFGRDSIYVELQNQSLSEQQQANEGMIHLAEKTKLKLVATNDIHYTYQKDSEAHDVLLCIQTGHTLNDPKRLKFGSQEFYMKSPEEMRALFGHIPGALENTLEIAERCNLQFDFSSTRLPDPGIPAGVDPSDHMESEARKGLAERMPDSIPESYHKQLEYECGIIRQCGFATYMMICRDFTDFARRQGIYVGIRGSAAGSLVCYALGIVDVDPIEYGLTFERFLNPERIEMPDVDLDIQDDRRDELIQYVIGKYGSDRVGQIATFGSLKARAAVRDCGRALGTDPAEVDRLAKMIPTIPVGVTIDQALRSNPEFQDAYNRSPDARTLIDTARTLEGLNRNVGVHAAGVLISDNPLTDHVPVQYGNKGEAVAQLAKKDIAKIGLVKMDFLGLANLTILADAVKKVKEHQGIDIDILNIPLDDKKTFEMLGRGDTNGVFQLESSGMRQNVIDLKPNSVRELAAIIALYRPGPMASIPNFVRGKFGQDPIDYLHPDLEPILSETYGVISYQDQVLWIARAIAGFTLGQADVLRKAMSIKDPVIMDEQRVKFLEGAKNRGVDEKVASQIYEQIEPFAGYGFNKAHAVCYAFVAYRTAYMKSTYPVEYYSALLSANMDDKDKLAMYVDDCKRFGIKMLPPDVNSSGVEFEVCEGALCFGLAAVKGVGRGAIDAVLEARKEGGPFKSLHEFARRVCDTIVGRSAIESLIKCGAFDSINKNRAQLLFILDDATSMALRAQRDKKAGQHSLFTPPNPPLAKGGIRGGEESEDYLEPKTLPQVEPMPRDEQLAVEKDLLGLYFSEHPLEQFAEKFATFVTATSAKIKEMADKQDVIVAGVISRIRKHFTKKNNEPMVFLTIEDLSGSMDVTAFPSVYRDYKDVIAQDAVVVVRGKTNHRERPGSDGETSCEIGIICESIQVLTNGNGNGKNGNGVGPKCLTIRLTNSDREKLKHLRGVFSKYSGESPVYFVVASSGKTTKVSAQAKVEPSPKLISEIEQVLGKSVVTVEQA